LAEDVITESQTLLAVTPGERDGCDLIQLVIAIFGAPIQGVLGDQPTCGVPFQVVNDGCLGAVYCDRLYLRDVVQWVVGVALETAVQAVFLGQPVAGVPVEPVAFTVLVGQALQAAVSIMVQRHAAAMGVNALM